MRKSMNASATKDQWKEWNLRGFIPGPEEKEEDFLRRIDFCECLENKLVEKVGASLPFTLGDTQSKVILKESFALTEKLYGIAPDWVPLFFSNHQLAPWHGGCAWIFQLDEESPTAAFLQLRARFKEQKTYLGLYHRKELVAHELAHIGRMMYEEPKFEELLAYQTAGRSWRKWLGPIVQSSKESLFFMAALGLYIITILALMSVDHPVVGQVSFGFQIFFLGIVLLALGRVVWYQSLYSRCFKKLEKICTHPAHLIYRLTDDEIKLFGGLSLHDIKQAIESKTSFRWDFLRYNYPLDKNTQG
jgi:hypothetical protein